MMLRKIFVLTAVLLNSSKVCVGPYAWPYLKSLYGPTTTPPPWQPGQIVQTKQVDTYPWVTRACPRNFCDPAPIFKILEATPTGTSFDLVDVLMPSDAENYQALLMDPDRKRLCSGKQFVHSKCSFFQEFVLVTGSRRLQILSIHDNGYDDIYLRMRFAHLNTNEDVKTTEAPLQDDEPDEFKMYTMYALIVFAIIIVLVVLRTFLKRCRERRSEEEMYDPSPRSRNLDIQRKWNQASLQQKNRSNSKTSGETDKQSVQMRQFVNKDRPSVDGTRGAERLLTSKIKKQCSSL